MSDTDEYEPTPEELRQQAEFAAIKRHFNARNMSVVPVGRNEVVNKATDIDGMKSQFTKTKKVTYTLLVTVTTNPQKPEEITALKDGFGFSDIIIWPKFKCDFTFEGVLKDE